MQERSLASIYCGVLLGSFIFLSSCSDQLRGKPTPAIPEIAGLYLNEKSAAWAKDNKLKIQMLWIRRTAQGELEFVNETLTRLQFSMSENREEMKLRSGKIITSGHELLFFESMYKELQRLYSGKNTSDPKNWDVKSFGPFIKVKEVGHLLTEGSGRSAEISENMNSIRFSNGEVYNRIGMPLLGRISISTPKYKKVIDNDVAGVVYYHLPPSTYPSKDGKEYITAFFSSTDNLSNEMPVLVGDVSGSIAEVFEYVAIIELRPKPGSKEISVPPALSPILLTGTVDKKAISQKEGTEELIRRLKQDPTVSKEELIRELERLKTK